jgi:hypothetical protein
VRSLLACSDDEVLLGWVNLGTPAPLGRKGLVAGSRVDVGDRVLRIDG